jgi:outer membrane protein OmpA-like peptidoglycan-associated protein
MFQRGYTSCRFLLAFCAVVALAPSALAQGNDTSIDVNTYWPAPGPGNYFALRGSAIAPHLGVGFTLDLNYQHKPLVLEVPGGSEEEVVQYQVTADFLWSLGLFNWIQVGLALPTVLAMDGVGASPVTGGARLATTAIRDLRFEVKARFLGGGPQGIVTDGFGLAAVAGLSVPTGDPDNFAGDRNVVGEPTLIADYRHRYFSLAANVGARLRAASDFANVTVGHQLTFGAAGAGYLVDGRLQILAELFGLAGLVGTEDVTVDGQPYTIEGNHAHLELRGGVGYVPDKERDITLRLGAAAGLTGAPGVPQFRVLASLQYQPQNRDSDGDGVLDRNDGCDTEREDMDDFDDEDGCPDGDNDEDQIPDGADQCPDEAEDLDEFQDDDGCPDYDNDGDGVSDEEDGCPNEPGSEEGTAEGPGCPERDVDSDGLSSDADQCPDDAEDMDGFEDGDGCPDPDNDGDNIADSADQCPNEAEDVDDYADTDGCPDLDNDGDSVPDSSDTCPDEAETINGVNDDDGCEDRGVGVRVRDDLFRLRGGARFERGSSEVSEAFLAQLVQVGRFLRTAELQNRQLTITAFGDRRGDEEANRALAQARGDAVRAALVQQGVAEGRLTVGLAEQGARPPAGSQVELRLQSPE